MRALLIDDHALFREGLRLLLRGLNPNVEVLEAGDAASARLALEKHSELDLVLLDLAIPGVEAFELLELSRALQPTVPVVVISANESRFTIERVMALGAQGYVFKSGSGEQLLSALRKVIDGDLVHPTSSSTDPVLTERQQQVLQLLDRGLSNRDLAVELEVAENTVKVHLANIYRALGAVSRTHALARARELGWVRGG